MNSILQTAIDAAQKAGKVLKKGFGTDYTISSKSQFHDLVTEYDHKSEAITWIIDPLDGTVNFAHGIPFFCVSIAAIQGNVILCGVIYSPMTEELFTAETGGGAFLNGQSYTVTQQTSLLHSFLVTGFPYSVKENPLHCIEHFAHIVGMGIPIRRLGSAALDLAYVAVGRFDGFWEVALQPWDMAAGALLVKEAGGIVIDYSGNDLNIMQSSSIIAGNIDIVKALRNEIDSVNLIIPKR